MTIYKSIRELIEKESNLNIVLVRLIGQGIYNEFHDVIIGNNIYQFLLIDEEGKKTFICNK